MKSAWDDIGGDDRHLDGKRLGIYGWGLVALRF